MPKKKPNSLDLLECGVDLEHRIIDLSSVSTDHESCETGVDSMLAKRVVNGITLLELQDPNGDKPIHFHMIQPGGDEFACAAIYDSIRHCKSPTTITVNGMAMSAGSIILQAAKKRIVMPSAWVMIHYGSWGYNDHPKIMYKWAKQGEKMDAWMEQVYLERIREKHPNFKLKDLEKLLNFDTILSAQESVDLGLADQVGRDE